MYLAVMTELCSNAALLSLDLQIGDKALLQEFCVVDIDHDCVLSLDSLIDAVTTLQLSQKLLKVNEVSIHCLHNPGRVAKSSRSQVPGPGSMGGHIVAFQPVSAIQAVQRATSGTVTMASLGAIFGMATCLSAQARDSPDDPLNYFIGGCASGVFLGARTHSAMTGTTACLGLGTLAMLTKVGKMEGWRLSGPPKL